MHTQTQTLTSEEHGITCLCVRKKITDSLCMYNSRWSPWVWYGGSMKNCTTGKTPLCLMTLDETSSWTHRMDWRSAAEPSLLCPCSLPHHRCQLQACALLISILCMCVYKIRPFMKAHLNREKDRELYKLAQYLKEIAKLDDFNGLNHKHWER